MIVIEDVRRSEQTFPHVVLTVGSFDGIHLGHRKILDLVVESARQSGGTPAVLTMRPHPRQFFSPDHAPNLLTSDKKKLELLEECGIDVAYILPFNKETAAIEARDFVTDILVGRCGAKTLIVGHDCRFGRGAKGDFELLRQMAPELNISVDQVPPLVIGSERVSSTLVRERVLEGDLEAVETYLGRKYSITGQVGSGRGMGEKLGYPTANVKPDHSAVPAHGVYIAEVKVREGIRPAAVNIGVAPTIRHEDITIEAHILDFNENIAGEEIEIVFHKRVRPEKKFPSVEALVEQIDRDVAETRMYFETEG